jgi:alkanesulfonate monooxygenase SsuD/methylene tetrahydromethanopterin reductase-like flavin-dependent oxidoreductase (luciferase family)
VETDLLLDTFGATWSQVCSAAVAAEQTGFDGLWVYDHVCGAVHQAPHVLECWTVLSGLAVVTSRVRLGPMVANMANRPAGVLAAMAATLQQVSGGRLLLGLGAGSGPSGGYAVEDRALGRTPLPAAPRRAALRRYVADLRQFWSGTEGFLRPSPPPVVIGALGPKMARLAGEVGDGVNLFARLPDLDGLVRTAREAAAGRDFVMTVLAPFDVSWLDPAGYDRRRLSDLGVDRLVLTVPPPYEVAGLNV